MTKTKMKTAIMDSSYNLKYIAELEFSEAFVSCLQAIVSIK